MTARERADRSLASSFERYLQDKGKGRGGDGGNYRRNAARELERFAEWAAGDRGRDDWTGVVPDGVDREPAFEDLDERIFREYARHLAGDRGLKQNTVQTYYRYISAWCGWCVNEGYLEAHYAQRASAMAPLPEVAGLTTVVLAGHYATETFGVRNLQSLVDDWDEPVETTFFDVPTGI